MPLCVCTCARVCVFVCVLHRYVHTSTVHDTENLTFSAEFRDCSARNDAEFPRGCRGTSARVDTDLPCGFGLKMAKFVRNNAKGSRNTPQGSFELSL